MKVLRPGHRYELDNFEQQVNETQVSTPENQQLQFIEKEPIGEGSKELVTIYDGTTNEEVLRMMIDRMKYLQDKMPCRENAIVITKLEESLMWLEKRTENRKHRGVEGTHQE